MIEAVFLNLKRNDIVVCINCITSPFKLNEKYNIDSINLTFKHIYIRDKFNNIYVGNYERFLLLKEYEILHRKDKLNNLLK